MSAATTIAVHTISESNVRGSWRRHAVRRARQRAIACWVMRAAGRPNGKLARITLRRVAPRRLDTGNLPAALKHVQDGVCDALGIDDGDQAIEWRYDQRKPFADEQRYGVEVEIE